MANEVEERTRIAAKLAAQMHSMGMGEPEQIRRPPRPSWAEEIAVGCVVTLHSLQSKVGRKINGKRALVLRWVEDEGRWECRIEGTPGDGTTAVRPSNMSTEFMPEFQADSLGEDETMLHPEYWEMSTWVMQKYGQHFYEVFAKVEDKKYRNARGVTYDDDPPSRRARKLVQLLDFPSPEDGYTPNQTILSGEAYKFNASVVENQMDLSSDLTTYHMEWLAAIIALAAMCQGEKMYARGCGDGEEEAVVFALLEAAPRSLTALLEFVVMTPYIGPAEDYVGSLAEAFGKKNHDAPALTWCQTSATYCAAMKAAIGMICFIITGTPQKVHVAFFRALERHGKLFPLFLQRLFKILAREVFGTPDGLAIGKYARNVLVRIADAVAELPVPFYIAMNEMDKTPVTQEAAARLVQEESIRSIDDLSPFLLSLADPEDAIEFFKRWNKNRGITEANVSGSRR